MEDKYTIAEEYRLPSGGAIYEKPVNPIGKLRSMTTREEMRRLAPTNTQYKVLSDIIETCMLEKPAIHVYDMCLGDFEYLLHQLRIVTHGANYKMTVLCPQCGNVQDASVNLDAMETKPFDISALDTALQVTLPKSGKVVKLAFQTPRTLDTIKTKTAELAKKFNDGMDYELLVTLQEAITEVDGQKLSFVQKENFINNLPAKDTNKLIQAIDKINHLVGLKGEITYKCERCGEDNTTFFRFGPEFFRPTDDE